MKTKWQTIAPLGIWLLIYLLPVPAGLNANQWHYFAVFAAVIAGLVLRSMPVDAIGLIGLRHPFIPPMPEVQLRRHRTWSHGPAARVTFRPLRAGSGANRCLTRNSL
jgi:hypothetical protein